MSITAITRDYGDNVSIVRITSTNTLAEVTASGYILAQVDNIAAANNGEFTWLLSDMTLVYASDGWVFASISSDFESLDPLVFSTTVVGAPVVVGNFTVFASTGGNIKDLGYLPTNAAKTKVVMANAAVTSGNIAVYTDTSGTVGDGPVLGSRVLTSGITTPDVGPNLVSFNVTVGQAALASAGSVILIDSSGSKQYKIKQLQLNSGGTNFSGGGGDRLGQVTDGTTVYSVVPAASLQTLANAQWGATALPNPAAAAINTSTVAGADLTFKYSGGTTDYTAGSLVISGLAERIA